MLNTNITSNFSHLQCDGEWCRLMPALPMEGTTVGCSFLQYLLKEKKDWFVHVRTCDLQPEAADLSVSRYVNTGPRDRTALCMANRDLISSITQILTRSPKYWQEWWSATSVSPKQNKKVCICPPCMYEKESTRQRESARLKEQRCDSVINLWGPEYDPQQQQQHTHTPSFIPPFTPVFSLGMQGYYPSSLRALAKIFETKMWRAM